MNTIDPKIEVHHKICDLSDLEESGTAFRYQVRCQNIQPFAGMNADPEDWMSAFVMLYNGELVSYLNRCAHLPMEMDWNPGDLLDEEKKYITCSTHYALYEPMTGFCVSGPCPVGSKLVPVRIELKESSVYLRPF